MNKYVVVGTYPNGNKRAYVVVADNYSKAIQNLLTEGKENFTNIEVIDTYGTLEAIGMASFSASENSFYRNASDALLLIVKTMAEYKISDAIDENGEATDEFHERFEEFFRPLSPDGKDALLTLAGTAKGIVNMIELAGHDCL